MLIFLLFYICNASYSQELNNDTIKFFKVQKQFEKFNSATINYRLNYVTTNFELHWDVESYFLKNNDEVFFYIKQIEDPFISEYVYYRDTLLIFAQDSNRITYDKKHTNKPFRGNIRRVFTFLFNEHVLTSFLSYDEVTIYDSVLITSQVNAIIGVASTSVNDNERDGYYKSKIILNKNNNSLVSCLTEVEVYNNDIFFHKASQEYIINEISLHRRKKRYIKDIIKTKYFELDSIITPNVLAKNDTLKKENSNVELPKYAYEWSMPLINGDTLRAKDINSKILVIDFYYMSCAPCILAINDMVKLDSIYNENDVSFVGANVFDNDVVKIDKFLGERNVEYTNVMKAKDLAEKYGFYSFPQIIFINTKTNEILYHFSGYHSGEFEHFKQILDGLLENDK